MKTRSSLVLAFQILVLPIVGLYGCVGIGNREHTGPLRTESKNAIVGGAKSESVFVKMDQGQLTMSGGAKDLLEGQFTYNIARWKPNVDYSTVGAEGTLHVEQEPLSDSAPTGARDDWNLRLADTIPIKLTVTFGMGKATLELGSLSLSSLQLNVGAADVLLDFNGTKQSVAAEIRGGAGKITVRLPHNVGVHVKVDGVGIVQADEFTRREGAYVNEALGKSAISLQVEIAGGAGIVRLELV